MGENEGIKSECSQLNIGWGGSVSTNVIALLFSVEENVVLVSRTRYSVVYEFFINAYLSYDIRKTTALLIKIF